MTFTDTELDALTVALKHEGSVMFAGRAPTALEAAAAITYLRTRDPIGAVIMQERAAGNVTNFAKCLNAEACLFLLRGNTEASRLTREVATSFHGQAAAIRALPIPTRAEVLAYALGLPEVRALVDAAEWAWQGLVAEYGHDKTRVNFGKLVGALEALDALEPKP